MAYIFGILALALGAALMERADFGMSMVVAPAYLLYLKISQYLTWFTFGIAEYCLQAVLIVIMALWLCKFKKIFLFSFITAFIYGNVLDAMIWLVGFIPTGGIAGRTGYYIGGILIGSVGVSLIFHTYITPEAYELFVKECAVKLNANINRVKTAYDCCSCLIAVILSFAFFGLWHFEGIKAGTILCALVNGFIIGRCSKIFERYFDFKDAFALRKYFA